jgi:hypothetical protein
MRKPGMGQGHSGLGGAGATVGGFHPESHLLVAQRHFTVEMDEYLRLATAEPTNARLPVMKAKLRGLYEELKIHQHTCQRLAEMRASAESDKAKMASVDLQTKLTRQAAGTIRANGGRVTDVEKAVEEADELKSHRQDLEAARNTISTSGAPTGVVSITGITEARDEFSAILDEHLRARAGFDHLPGVPSVPRDVHSEARGTAAATAAAAARQASPGSDDET